MLTKYKYIHVKNVMHSFCAQTERYLRATNLSLTEIELKYLEFFDV